MTNLPHLRLYRLGTAAALVVAPLLFLVDNLLHPKEVARGNEIEQVVLISQDYTRWQAAHVITTEMVLLIRGVLRAAQVDEVEIDFLHLRPAQVGADEVGLAELFRRLK